MHNQRISFVFLFSSRQRRISSFLKKPIHTTRIRPTLLFFVPPIRVVFSQFRRQFEISLPFIMRGSRKKSGKTSRNERRRRLEWQPRLSGCYKQGSTQRPYNIRKHKTHTDVLNRSLLFYFHFFSFLFYFIFVAFFFGSVSPAVVCRWWWPKWGRDRVGHTRQTATPPPLAPAITNYEVAWKKKTSRWIIQTVRWWPWMALRTGQQRNKTKEREENTHVPKQKKKKKEYNIFYEFLIISLALVFLFFLEATTRGEKK